MDDMKPITELETHYTKNRIMQLCYDGRVRAEKRRVGNQDFWYVSQEDVTAYELEAEAAGTSKHAWRHEVPEAQPEPVA